MPKQTKPQSFTTFDTPEESARVFAIITEADPFRLVIRGHALVDEILDAGINAAFRDGTPAELKRLRLPARLALAEAIELVTPQVVAAIKALAKIRNRLAHGGDDAVTSEEVRALREAFEPFLDDEIDLDNWKEDDQLRILVSGVWSATGWALESAFEKRAELEEALAESRKQHALSTEQVTELLRRANEQDAASEGSS